MTGAAGFVVTVLALVGLSSPPPPSHDVDVSTPPPGHDVDVTSTTLPSHDVDVTSTTLPSHDVDVTSVARVFLDQIGDTRYVFSIVDTQVSPILDLRGVLPERCTPLPPETAGVYVSAGFAFECTSELTFDDVMELPWSLAGVVAIVRWGDGTEASAYFRGDGRSVPIRLADLRAGAGTTGRLAGTYFILGGEHILFGDRSPPLRSGTAPARQWILVAGQDHHRLHRRTQHYPGPGGARPCSRGSCAGRGRDRPLHRVAGPRDRGRAPGPEVPRAPISVAGGIRLRVAARAWIRRRPR